MSSSPPSIASADPAAPVSSLSADEKRTLLASLLRGNEHRARTFPVSFSQQRLWFLDQLTPGNPFYNTSNAVRLKVPLLFDVLERSINEIVRRHESLRTTFIVLDGQPMQAVAPEVRIPLQRIDLRNLPPTQRETEALRLAKEEAHRPFDLARGPLLRITLFQLDTCDHVFLLTQHHIVSDAWSMGIFSRELTALYTAFASAQPSPLPPLKLQYGDFTAWQRGRLQGETLRTQLDYWKQQLANLPTLQLPTDHPRPSIQTYRGATHTFHLSPSLSVALKRVSQAEGTTLFITLLTGFYALLHRYTGQSDLAVGTYIANRNRAEVEELIGFFVNTLVLRTDASGDLSFRQWLRRAHDVVLGAHAHQDLPFEMLVEHLHPDRDLGRNPLFQVVFQMPTTAPTLAATDGSAVPLLDVKPASALFDLSVSLWEMGGRLIGQMEYACDLFEASTIERMAAHLVCLFEALTTRIDQPVNRASLLTAVEKRLLLQEWNSRPRPLADSQSIPALFEQQVRRSPDAPAFICGGDTLTFSQLDRRARVLAHQLRRRGVRAGASEPVGVFLDRSLDLPAAMLAIWMAGGVYVPLDPGYPPDRLAFIAAEARVSIVLSRSTLKDSCPAGAEILLVDPPGTAALEGPDATDPSDTPTRPIKSGADELAYVIFTSGSTGRPKGVAVEHRQILNRLAWMWNDYPFEPGEVGCQKTALNFVDSLWELLGPLLKGVPTVIVPDAVLRDPRGFIDQLAQHHVTRLWLVPSYLRTLLGDCPDLASRLPRLRFWVSSGEPLALDLFQEFSRRMPGHVLYNLYGTSEVWDATWFDPTRDGAIQGAVPIGRPIDNVEVYVLDPHLQPTPAGVPGELYVGGVGLAREYLHRPELTAEKFIPHPFSSQPAARLYRTGDLARFRPDGNLEFLGRVDHQVKIRGYRVEPGEIESVLAGQPDVREATVVALHEPPSEPRLVAYIVPRRPDSADSGIPVKGTLDDLLPRLQQTLRQRLPEYMVPSVFVPLESLPLTPSGKIDRRALPHPDQARWQSARVPAPPRTPIERTLCAIFGELLNVREVGIHDDFFRDLGGHSLLATQLVSRVRNQLQFELPLRRLFQTPTVHALAAELELHQNQPAPDAPVLTRVAREKYRLNAQAS